jgi:hypothetical protein
VHLPPQRPTIHDCAVAVLVRFWLALLLRIIRAFRTNGLSLTSSSRSRRSWDLRSLCKSAGQEYKAYRVNAPSPAPGEYQQNIVFSKPLLPPQRLALSTSWPRRAHSSPSSFAPLASPDLCGTVSQVVAPYKDPAFVPPGTANMELPLPHSHGTAVQYIADPGQGSQYTCPDVDTCDQDTNPACLPGSLNYPVGGNTVSGSTQNPFSSSIPIQISRNLYRESRCSSGDPPIYCFVASVPCESSGVINAYYDGTGAVRALCRSWRRTLPQRMPPTREHTRYRCALFSSPPLPHSFTDDVAL